MNKPVPYVETVEDSRVRGMSPVTGAKPRIERATIDRGAVRIYCLSCSHPGAFVSEDIPGVIFLCDATSACGCDCAGTKGELPLPRLAI